MTKNNIIKLPRPAYLSLWPLVPLALSFAPQADGGINIKDDSLGVDWCIPVEKALLDEKYTKLPLLKDFDSPFSIDKKLYPEFK